MNEEDSYAISFTLLKFIGFFQMINPNSPKRFGYSIYHMIHIFLVVLTTTVAVTGLTGLIYHNNDSLNNGFQNIRILFSIAVQTIGNIKVIITICNADELWKTFEIAHESFSSNKYCKKNRFKVLNCRKHFRRTSIWYIIIFYMAAFFWILLPNVVNIDETATNNYIRKINILNLKYPIKVETYNTYYNAIYVIEAIVCVYSIFGLILFDIFLFEELQLISIQYEMLSSAYENMVFIDQNEDGKSIYYF